MPDTVTVSVPPNAAHLHILRQVAGGVAASVRVTIDDLDDLKLAVNEAAGFLLSRFPDASAISLSIDHDSSSLNASVSAEVLAGEWGLSDIQETLSWRVIQGLTDEAGVHRDDHDRPVIAFMKRTMGPNDR